MQKGSLIVFEGIDGCGKTTQVKNLKKWFLSKKVKVFTTKEPTDSIIGRNIRQLLKSRAQTNMYVQASLFFADRIEHINDRRQGIKKYLSDGYIVICDRYYYSSFAYQGLHCDLNWIMNLHYECPNILKPDLVIFLDVPPPICNLRIRNRQQKELYEKLELMIRIRKNFMMIFDLIESKENIKIIPGSRSCSKTMNDILEEVLKIVAFPG